MIENSTFDGNSAVGGNGSANVNRDESGGGGGCSVATVEIQAFKEVAEVGVARVETENRAGTAATVLGEEASEVGRLTAVEFFAAEEVAGLLSS